MALKRVTEAVEEQQEIPGSISGRKARELFSRKEKKILTTFSIEPSFKAQLEEMFGDMGLGWAAGIRFALKEFYKKHSDEV